MSSFSLPFTSRVRAASSTLVPWMLLAASWAACGDDSSSPGNTAGSNGTGNGNAGTDSGDAGTGGTGNNGGGGGGSSVEPDPTKDCGTPSDPAVPELELTPLVDGLTRPILLTQPPGESERLFVVEKNGYVRIVQNGALLDDPFLDLEEEVSERFDEMGLLGLAFHPDYAQNRRFYVYYSTIDGGQHISRIAEYTALADDPDVADVASERVLLEVEQPEDNHNGGHLAFGSDGFLYIALGDGGGGGDQHGDIGNGQNLQTLLGKILRIDVDGSGAGPNGNYAIPAGNLTADGALPEIWSYGWRNPWRYSFDACTGDMYIADVGQSAFEEVDFEPAQTGGRNYGWRLMEAEECFNPNSGCDAAAQNLTLPVASYGRNLGQSITGGYVYRGSAIPALRGTYLYADYQSARFFALRMANGAVATPQADITDNLNPDDNLDGISSFGQDTAGNLYVVEYGGAVYRIDAE